MTKATTIILPFLLLFTSCEDYKIDPNYPTTFRVLPSETLSQKRTSFASKNKYLITSINEFGFCDFLEDLLIVDSPPIQDLLTKSEAIELVKIFCSKNPTETGVKNPDELTFTQISSSSDYGGSIGWVLRSSYQKVDTLSVIFSVILFHITNREVTFCVGNWFPDIYIPEKFNITQKRAKTDLIGRYVSNTTIAGEEYQVIISNADIEESTTNLAILPITTDDKIELRVAWLINIPHPVYYKIYVDVMTGEIIGQEPTIIS